MTEPAEDIAGRDRSQAIAPRVDQGVHCPRCRRPWRSLELAELLRPRHEAGRHRWHHEWTARSLSRLFKRLDQRKQSIRQGQIEHDHIGLAEGWHRESA